MESPPLARFLRSLGRVQHHVHTVVVGLSAVEVGAALKPDDLDIAWRAQDPIGSAREARRFVLRATLIFLAEELNEYAIQVLKYRSLASAVSVPEDRAERIRSLSRGDEVDPSYLSIAALLVSHWRNRIVHRSSRAHLLRSERDRMLTARDAIREAYKGIDVTRLLEDFETDQPTLKDVTVLLAMSIKFLRLVDSTLPSPETGEGVRLWLETEGILGEVLKLEKEAEKGGNRDPRGRARQYLVTKSPTLAQPYYIHGAESNR
jgi:hypothetical protein